MSNAELIRRRTFVLDTNVLIHDPTSPLNFDEHHVVIPMGVLEELDSLKQEQSDRGRQARQAVRLLDDLMTHQPTVSMVEAGAKHVICLPKYDEITPHGYLRFESVGDAVPAGLDLSVKDNQILGTAHSLSRRLNDGSVVLVTNDINLRVKAAAIGMTVEGYRSDAVLTDHDAMTSGVWVAKDGAGAFWESFETTGVSETLAMEDGTVLNQLFTFTGQPVSEWHPGMMVSDGSGDFDGRVVDIIDGKAYVQLLKNYSNSQDVWGVRAKDNLQNFALNLVLDPEIDLVTIAGPAGTGKTFLALAAALKMVFDDRRYERIVITRETVAMGEQIGFLPGDETEKMAPWCAAFIDNIEQIVGAEKGERAAAAMDMINRRLQMRSLGLMRGRTFTDTVLIIDEAQNLSPKQIKNLVTRAGSNTKVICLGNVAQIDTPYISHPGSTGLATLVQNFRSWRHAGHITLQGIQRSRLAAQAELVL